MDPDPDSDFWLDPDPNSMNMDPKYWSNAYCIVLPNSDLEKWFHRILFLTPPKITNLYLQHFFEKNSNRV